MADLFEFASVDLVVSFLSVSQDLVSKLKLLSISDSCERYPVVAAACISISLAPANELKELQEDACRA